MQIELIGCTSAGKSTLAQRILRDFRAHDIPVLPSEEFVLRHIGAQWVRGRIVRTLLIDMIALAACLRTCRKNVRFCLFALRAVARLPVGLIEKLNLSRNVLRKVGIYELIRRNALGRQVVLVDEGTLHAAHNIFVHAAARPCAADVSTFARLAPLPDVAVYVRHDKRVLLTRTLQRGHRRIPPRSPKHTARFVTRAVEAFESLVQQAAVKQRLLVVDQRQKPLAADAASPSDT
ncbi:MAG: hypothetical protein V3R99_01820 [Thermoguttaceae bacterium]